MNRPDSRFQTVPLVPLPPPDASPPVAAKRLIAVIPYADEEAALASRILTLARPRGLQVLLFGICPDPDEEAGLRRKLVTIAAFIRDERLSVEIRMEHGKDQIEKVKAILRHDDMLACYAEQNVGPWHKSLSDALLSSVDIPIYILSGLRPSRPTRKNLFLQAVSWLGSIAAIGGFFLLQVKITEATDGWVQTALLLLTLFVEVGLIWTWNSLFA